MSAPPWLSSSTMCKVARGSCLARRQTTPSGEAMSSWPRTKTRRNIDDAVDAPADPIRGEECVLAEEVSHQSGEPETKRRVGVARARFGRSAQGRESFFPRAPGSGGTVS